MTYADLGVMSQIEMDARDRGVSADQIQECRDAYQRSLGKNIWDSFMSSDEAKPTTPENP